MLSLLLELVTSGAKCARLVSDVYGCTDFTRMVVGATTVPHIDVVQY